MDQSPIGISLSPCQQKALALLAEGDQNVFLTGDAGTGKSFLIRHFLRRQNRRSFPVLASTGAAAVLVGGRTFHSFFGLGILEGGVERTVLAALANRRIVNRLRKIDGFVLDEVSMIPGPVLSAAEQICRQAREDRRPWGGARVIAVGDFAQLPPVATGQAKTTQKEWAFLDPAWERSEFQPSLLQTIMRTDDAEYVSILNRIRAGQVDDKVEAYLNRKVDCDSVDQSMTHLFSRRNQAEAFSKARLDEIREPLRERATQYSGQATAIERLKKVAPVPELLALKKTALVMMRINDPQWRYVNGSVGTVEQMTDEVLSIQLRNGRVVEVQPVSFSMLDAEGKVIATASNFPVNLAYATTIHKAQGSTLESLVVNLRGLWDPGQAYVALSRLQNGCGLTLTAWDRASITIDPDVVHFHQGLGTHA